MPGYGIVAAHEGQGLLPWKWAIERLVRSREYWVATAGLEAGVQLSPVWGVWADSAFWFSCSAAGRKARNLDTNPRCTVATADVHQPVVLEGRAALVSDPSAVESFATASDQKYETNYGVEFYLANACFRIDPDRVFGLDDADFTGTPTRWVFPRPPR
jgi:hypothetical protein